MSKNMVCCEVLQNQRILLRGYNIEYAQKYRQEGNNPDYQLRSQSSILSGKSKKLFLLQVKDCIWISC